MEKVDIPEGVSGKFRVEIFETDRPDFGSMLRGRSVPVGETYTRLMRGGTLVMSDTPSEMRDHLYAVGEAHGHCLLNGLGIGMVLKNILLKTTVERVTVVEVSPEVVELVGPHYKDERVEIVCVDAFDFKPPKGVRYQMVWHDIWDNICADNLPEMHRLHRKYGKRADWQGSWCRGMCERGR